MKNPGQTLKIFLVDGFAGGLKVIEKSNWIGKAVACSRSQFPKVKDRPEFKKTGVYLIYAQDAGEVIPTIYIGEGDPVLQRLESHDRNKDFWENLILFTSKDESLNKAHIQYLESRLVELANKAKKCNLENGNSPTLPALSESDIADMEAFLDNMILIYGVLGISVFETPSINIYSNTPNPVVQNSLSLSGGKASAVGFESIEGFIVLKGAKANLTSAPSMSEGIKAFREWMIKDGLFERGDDYFTLTQDYTFSSPSKASSVLLGRNSNGRIEWKNKEGITLKELQDKVEGEK